MEKNNNFILKESPIFVYVHGGYWQTLDKNDSAYCVLPLSNHFKVVIVEYTLCPKISLENLILQFKKFGRHILNYANEMNSRY